MPIYVPPPSQEAFADVTAETIAQRKNTHWFILADPTTVALTPTTETQLSSGGTSIVSDPARAAQTFRLIPTSHTERPQRSVAGTAGTSSGQQRRHDFTLLGEWDAAMAPGDWWEDERGEKWIIDEMVPFNGYERKGLVTAYGKTR